MKNLPPLKGLETLLPEAALAFLAEQFPQQVCFSTSLGLEDQLVTHFIFQNKLPITIFTLQTGRLFKETEELLHQTQNYYGQKIEIFEPQADTVAQLEREKGRFSFYDSIENRKECCQIRKVEPLQRALSGFRVWVTGIRAQHSENRQNLPIWEWDEKFNLYKFHPLLHWTYEEVFDTIKKQQIPYNPLHEQGFVSIGCEPCTRAVKAGEDFRAGRWWWESSQQKECGLHTKS
ncbi:phosphoadenylyl-sulfate reductase [Hugenholtzia roseola]|uniref:phosphoadenylyl-sulfate reductase n=1 Tax=Hugenholtzia roseola TaxID=1002 RepID=UPI00040322B3|nr:phosphoadenylyl-sulfate reductase [Hugenholtzia roseola]